MEAARASVYCTMYIYVVLSTRGCLTSLAAPIALYVLPFSSYYIGVHHHPACAYSSRCFSYDLSLPEPDPDDFFLNFCMKPKSGFFKSEIVQGSKSRYLFYAAPTKDAL